VSDVKADAGDGAVCPMAIVRSTRTVRVPVEVTPYWSVATYYRDSMKPINVLRGADSGQMDTKKAHLSDRPGCPAQPVLLAS